MRPHQLLPILLVLTLTLTNLVLTRIVHANKLFWPDVYCIVGLGLIFAQVTLLSSWLIWGWHNIAMRMALCVVVLYLLAYPTSDFAIDSAAAWFAMDFSLLATLSLVFWTARFRGYSIHNLAATKQRLIPPLGKWQYSVGGILSLTTGLSFLFSAVRQLQFPRAAGVSTGLFFAALATNSALVFFLAFRIQRPWLAATLVVISGVLFGSLMSLSAVGHATNWSAGWLSLVQVAVIAGSVTVLRTAKYELRLPTTDSRQPL